MLIWNCERRSRLSSGRTAIPSSLRRDQVWFAGEILTRHRGRRLNSLSVNYGDTIKLKNETDLEGQRDDTIGMVRQSERQARGGFKKVEYISANGEGVRLVVMVVG